MKMSIQSPHRIGLFQRLSFFAIILSALMLNIGTARAQPSPPSRPILFVHGICASATTDAPQLFGPLYQQLDSSMYPSATIYYVLYDSVLHTVTFSDASGSPVDESSIPSDMRFFSIQLYDPIDGTTDPSHVAKISILNKAYEISKVIKEITSITHIQDVLVVAHSMGGGLTLGHMLRIWHPLRDVTTM